MTKPICPVCNERLVFVAIAMSGHLFKSWMCDCDYRGEDKEIIPPGLIADIVRAREWDDGSVSVDASKLAKYD